MKSGTDVDEATFNISNRANIALPRLPEEVRRIGLKIEKRSNDILMVFMLISKEKGKYDPLYLSNYATLNVLDELKRTKGVGDVQVFGGQDYSMRIWLRPDRMAQLGIATTDITAAIQAQNAQYAAGKIGQEPMPPDQQLIYTVNAKGRLLSPSNSVISFCAPRPARCSLLKDVARIELGAQSYDVRTALNGEPGAGMPVISSTRRECARHEKCLVTKMDELKKRFPPGMDYVVPYDTSQFVKASMWEVVKTLGEAMVLVYSGRLPVPAKLARHADSPHRGAHFADRHLCRLVDVRLLHQYAYAFCHGPVDRDRGGRCNRGAGKHRAPDGRGKISPMKAAIRSMEQVAQCGGGHCIGADGGFCAGGFHGRNSR